MKKHYPKVKVYTRAYDVEHGLSLEKVRSALLLPGLQAHAYMACVRRWAQRQWSLRRWSPACSWPAQCSASTATTQTRSLPRCLPSGKTTSASCRCVELCVPAAAVLLGALVPLMHVLGVFWSFEH